MKKIYDRLLILSVAFGIIISMFSACWFKTFIDELNAVNTMNNNKFCFLGGTNHIGFSLNSALRIENIAHKKHINITMQSGSWNTDVSLSEKNIIPAIPVTTDCNFLKITGSKLKSGRFFTETEFNKSVLVCVISQDLKYVVGKKKTLFIYGHKVRIIGTVKVNKNLVEAAKVFPQAFVSYDAAVFMPATTISKYCTNVKFGKARNDKDTFDGFSGVTQFIVNNVQNNKVENITNILSSYTNSKSRMDSLSPSMYGVSAHDITKVDVFKRLLDCKNEFIFVIIALVLVMISMFYISSAKTYDKQREIGIKLALGAKTTNILNETASEIFICSLKGTYIGITGASVLCAVYNKALGSFAYSFDIITILIAFIFSIIITSIAAIVPAYRASQFEPVAVLKGE